MGRRVPDPPELLRLARGQCGLVTRAQAVACGMHPRTIDRRIKRNDWTRAGSGVYEVAPSLGPTSIYSAQRREVEIAMLAGGTEAVAVGIAALLLHGNWAIPREFVPRVVLATRGYRDAGPARSVTQHDGFASATVAGRRVATVEWAIIQALPELSRVGLIAVLDSALNRQHLRDLDTVLRLSCGRRGARLLRAVAPFVDPRSESKLETTARVQCLDAGIPPDALQLEFREAGVVVARADLAWRLPDGRWLLVEIDGVSVHDTPEAVFKDRARANMLLGRAGAVVLRFTARDLARRDFVPNAIKEVIARCNREILGA